MYAWKSSHMSQLHVCLGLLAVLGMSVCRSPSVFADCTIPPGETLELKEDFVLTGDDVLEINGTAEKRCTLVGNDFCIRSEGNWTGSIKLRHCDVKGLGAAVKFTEDKSRIQSEFPALRLVVGGKGSLVVEDCVFDASGAVHLQNDGESTTVFRNNTILENTLAHANKDIDKSRPCFVAKGNSRAKKLFQGNRIWRSQARFTGPNWLVGGESDADSNLCIGIRRGRSSVAIICTCACPSMRSFRITAR
jgi:hypothetical protein